MESLVSIIIATYNSGAFVKETLESAKLQSYKNIELIVTDDGSTDETTAICKAWIAENKGRFVRTDLITVPKNTGIPANLNRGRQSARGEWIKYLAGDDVLLPNCIEDNINHVITHPEVKALYSYNKVYMNEFKEENFIKLLPKKLPLNIISPEITAQDQHIKLLIADRIPFTPSIFLNKEALTDMGVLDEDLFSEDYQTKLRLTKKGYKLHFMEKETVLYRQHSASSNNMIKKYILKPHYFKTENLRTKYIYPYIPFDLRWSQKYSWVVNQIFKIDFFNQKNKLNKMIYYVLNIVLNPFKYVIYFKQKFLPKYKNNVFYQ